MNVPHENSPVVGTPSTRAGGGSSDLIAPRCTASSLPRNVFTSSRRVAVETLFACAVATKLHNKPTQTTILIRVIRVNLWLKSHFQTELNIPRRTRSRDLPK